MSRYGTLKNNEGNKIYPNAYYKIGDIFITTNNENPANRFGGTWEKLPDETFLMTASSNYTVKSTGGENEHTLTIDEMPSHNHGFEYGYGHDASASRAQYFIGTNNKQSDAIYNQTYIKTAGGGQAHNNVPKFYAVYVWIRVA